MNGQRIADSALQYLGTPHINGAKVKGIGVDCGMLLIAAMEDSGEMDKGSLYIKPYSNEWQLHHSEEWFLSYVKTIADEITEEELQPGDFIMYQYGRCVSHASIYLGNGMVIHSVLGQGVIITSTNDVMFLNKKGESRVRGYYRYKGRGRWKQSGPV